MWNAGRSPSMISEYEDAQRRSPSPRAARGAETRSENITRIAQKAHGHVKEHPAEGDETAQHEKVKEEEGKGEAEKKRQKEKKYNSEQEQGHSEQGEGENEKNKKKKKRRHEEDGSQSMARQPAAQPDSLADLQCMSLLGPPDNQDLPDAAE